MKHLSAVIMAGICSMTLAANACARDKMPMATVSNYQALVGQFVNLKKTLFEEQQRWDEQKAYLKQEKELLLKEKKLLEERIAEAKQTKSDHEVEVLQIKQKIEDSQKALVKILPDIERAEIHLMRYNNTLPKSLLKNFVFYKKKIDKEEKAGRRLQNVLAGYAYLEQINNAIKLTQELLTTEKEETMIFDVVYLGLAQAYAVSKDNQWAALGTLRDDAGWSWQWISKRSDVIREAVKLIEGDETAKLLHLPVAVTGGAE